MRGDTNNDHWWSNRGFVDDFNSKHHELLIASIRKNKPTIKVFNKSDLADPVLTEQWQNHFERDKGIKTLCVTRDQPDKIKQISSLCRKMISISDSKTCITDIKR